MLKFDYSAHGGCIPYMLAAALVTLLICPLLAWAATKIYKYKKHITVPYDGSILEDKVRAYIKSSFGVLAAKSVLFYIGPCRTTEVDLLAAIPQGVLCIECKHRKDRVSGRITDDYWYVTSSGGKTVDMENPVKQNFFHTMAVNDFFKENNFRQVPVYNIVIMEAGGLDIVSTGEYRQTYIFKDAREMETLKKLPVCLDKKETELLNAKFRTLQATDTEMQAHIQNVQNA